ncbi:sugar ABC transporter permease [Saccharopolyspora rhizosphaerae]|uniref:Sugar ABC transporter permease n=1 Tax=Saccharopolyspora rhizosphaerae TaxID=2492662 RepID=A0A3R8NVZ7_9PSEU|nr:sugar ABC transporter permease [Saccharopolyspora rhizosphaerae]RRO14159.1 sugar ABC transporter permease [Saccharopolyspora rhizosphaerae]
MNTRRAGSGFAFVAPFLAAYVLFLVLPLGMGLVTSLTNASLTGGSTEFVGLANFAEALTDPAMWQSFGVTVGFTAASTPPLVLAGLVMALLTHHLAPARWLWRLAFFAPYVLPSSAIALIFTWIYQPDFGLADSLLSWLGIGPVGWLAHPVAAMLGVVVATVWWTVGFNFLLYLAALQAIPDDLYEASSLDGAGGWRQLWHITLPGLRPTTGLVAVLQVLASLKVFDQFYLITNGGPQHSTRPILQYVYESGFTHYRTGYGSAVSYVFFGAILLVTLTHLSVQRRRAAGGDR